MDSYENDLNACLLYRNKQLTKQLKDYQRFSVMVESSSLMVAMGQLMCLRRKPAYGLVKDGAEWENLFIIIDMFYGGCLAKELKDFPLGDHEVKVCYLLRARIVWTSLYNNVNK